MVTISGRHVRGFGAANQTLRAQMQHLMKSCPELAGCFHGTINVILDCQLDVVAPDHVIGPIDWSGDGVGELFGLRNILFELSGEQPANAWLYIPYRSAHRLNPFHVEIIAPEMKLQPGASCKVHFDRALRVTV